MSWNDKYKPSSMYEIDHIQNMFLHSIEKKNLPHLLLHGPSSSGKSLFIHKFAGSIFLNKVLEINSCDEHGIEVIRDKIKNFSKVSGFKLIIIDEFHYQNNLAQSALRRIIEDYSSSTRFCFITNNLSKIIEPIRSRCMIIRFNRLSINNNLLILKNINEKEKLGLSDQQLKDLIISCDRDTRKAIQSLQFPNEFPNTKVHLATPQSVISSGVVVIDYLHDLFRKTMEKDISDKEKCRISELLHSCEKNLINGGDEFLNLNKLFLEL